MNLPRGCRPSGLLALALVLGAPALAQAQLFPNLPIRRERPDCLHENPQYKTIRQEYWGYYPTCWRRFPAGWGCPSPEAPNWEQAKRDLPPDPLPESGAADPGADTEPATEPGAPLPRMSSDRPGDSAFPPLPNETSPFDPERPIRPPATPPAPGGPPPAPAPGAAPPLGDAPGTPPTATRARKRGGLVAGLLANRRR